MKQRKSPAREAVLAALPGTHAEIHAATGVSLAAVTRWLAYLRDNRQAHIGDWKRSEKCPGISVAIYHPGPGADVRCRLKRSTQKDRDRRSRETRRKNGDWDDVLARRRAAYWRDKAPRRDPLTAALFGAA